MSGGKIAKEFYESDSTGMYAAIIGVFILLVILYYIYACFRKYAKECDRGIENFSAQQIEQILLRQVRIIRLYGLYKLAYVLFFVIFFLIGFFGFLATR
ncbi:MAG: hypothetical protein J6M05_02555 [Cardiobacteriaceae bacterium]|nr:hypothetical protein [Cardiobacteriaceae bacterium]